MNRSLFKILHTLYFYTWPERPCLSGENANILSFSFIFKRHLLSVVACTEDTFFLLSSIFGDGGGLLQVLLPHNFLCWSQLYCGQD